MRPKFLIRAVHMMGGALVLGCGSASDAGDGTLKQQSSNVVTGMPSPLLVSPVGSGTAPLPTYRWNPVPAAQSYNLWVNDSTGVRVKESYTVIQGGCQFGVGMCSVTPSTALNPGNGKWWVQAQGQEGLSAWSTPLTFNVPSGPPVRPDLASPRGTTSTNKPTYTWAASSAAADYYLWVNDAGGTRVQNIYSNAEADCATQSVCAVTPDIVLRPGQGQFWVQARNHLGNSAWSSALVFIVPDSTGAPLPPVLLSPRGTVATNKPPYTWTASMGAAEYYLWVTDAGGVRIQRIYSVAEAGCGETSVCSVTPDTALEAGLARYWVQARNSRGSSAWGTALTFMVPMVSGAPSAPTPLAPTGEVREYSNPTYEWTASAGATRYDLEINDAAGMHHQQTVTADDAGCAASSKCAVTPYGYDTLTKRTLQFRVRAQNDFGSSNWSVPLSFDIVQCPAGSVDGTHYVRMLELTTFTTFPRPSMEIGSIFSAWANNGCFPHLEQVQLCVGSSGCFALPAVTLTDPGSVRLGDWEPLPSGISWQASDTMLLCDGPCSEPSNVIDAIQFGTSPPPLPAPLAFQGGPLAQIPLNWEHQRSYQRVAFAGDNPNFQAADWTQQLRWHDNLCPPPPSGVGGPECDPATSPPICSYDDSPNDWQASCFFWDGRQSPGEPPRWWYLSCGSC